MITPALFLMGIGPLAQWKMASLPELAVRIRWAAAVSVATALLLPMVLGKWTPLLSLGVLLAGWIFATALLSVHERLSRLVGGSLWNCLMSFPRSYWGMILAHCGVAVFIVGVTFVKGFETEMDVSYNFV